MSIKLPSVYFPNSIGAWPPQSMTYKLSENNPTLQCYFRPAVVNRRQKNHINQERHSISFSEEIDFQGLIEYIRNDLLDEVETRVFNPNSKKRGEARRHSVDGDSVKITVKPGDDKTCIETIRIPEQADDIALEA